MQDQITVTEKEKLQKEPKKGNFLFIAEMMIMIQIQMEITDIVKVMVGSIFWIL